MAGIIDQARARMAETRNVEIRTPGIFDASGLADAPPPEEPRNRRGGGGMKLNPKKKVTEAKLREVINKLTDAGYNRQQIHEKMKEALGSEWVGNTDGRDAVIGQSQSWWYLTHGTLMQEGIDGGSDPYETIDDKRLVTTGYDIKDAEDREAYGIEQGSGGGGYFLNQFEANRALTEQWNNEREGTVVDLDSSISSNSSSSNKRLEDAVDASLANAEAESSIGLDDFSGGGNPHYDVSNYDPFSSITNDPFGGIDYSYDDYSNNRFEDRGGNPHWNTGGTVYASNGANLQQHPGAPRGTDQVPAWLTEGEFVVDKDSARRFAPQLEAMNAWQPNQGGFEGAISDLEKLINKQAFNKGRR